MGMWNNGTSPVTTTVTFNYPMVVFAHSLHDLIQSYPSAFLKKKENVGIGYFVFDRPKGIDTPTIEVRMSNLGPQNTSVVITATTAVVYTSSADLQIDVSEIVDILSSKLHGVINMEAVIKRNNSGNGLWGHIKTLGCLLFVIIFTLLFIGTCIDYFTS